MPERACFELCWRHARGWIRTRSRWLSKDEAVALPPDDDIGGPSASTTACRSGVVESACLPLRTAQASKARSNATVGFALSLLGSLVRSPQSRNQWWLSPQPVALSVGHRQRMSVPRHRGRRCRGLSDSGCPRSWPSLGSSNPQLARLRASGWPVGRLADPANERARTGATHALPRRLPCPPYGGARRRCRRPWISRPHGRYLQLLVSGALPSATRSRSTRGMAPALLPDTCRTHIEGCRGVSGRTSGRGGSRRNPASRPPARPTAPGRSLSASAPRRSQRRPDQLGPLRTRRSRSRDRHTAPAARLRRTAP